MKIRRTSYPLVVNLGKDAGLRSITTWYCESEQETGRDTQRYHALLLRARRGESPSEGYLTSRNLSRRCMMRLMYEKCAALDVHKQTVVGCPRWTQGDGRVQSEVRTFGTTTPELLAL